MSHRGSRRAHVVTTKARRVDLACVICGHAYDRGTARVGELRTSGSARIAGDGLLRAGGPGVVSIPCGCGGHAALTHSLRFHAGLVFGRRLPLHCVVTQAEVERELAGQHRPSSATTATSSDTTRSGSARRVNFLGLRGISPLRKPSTEEKNMSLERRKAEQSATRTGTVALGDKVSRSQQAFEVDAFAPLRALVEQMTKNAYEDGRKTGLADGRANGLRRARELLGVTMGRLSLDDRNRLANAVESLEGELMR